MGGRPAGVAELGPGHRGMNGIYVGTVTRVAGRTAYVRVERLGGARSYGPCEVIESLWRGFTTTADGGAGHSHALGDPAPLAAGDRVVVAFLEGRPDDLVVLGRLAS